MRWLAPVLLLCACEEAPDMSVEQPDEVAAPVCEPVASTTIDEPWQTIDAIGTSPDALTLSMLGEWRGQFEDANGDYQPASLFMYPADAPAQTVEWASEDGPCWTEVVIPVDIFFDVPCLIYGDIATTVTIREAGSGVIALNKIDAPRNLLDRPDFDAPIAARGRFEEGVMAFEVLWDGEEQDQRAGLLSAALQ